jgi:hypothetical protein
LLNDPWEKTDKGNEVFMIQFLITVLFFTTYSEATEKKVKLSPPAGTAQEAGSASRLLHKTPAQLEEFSVRQKVSGVCVNETGQALSSNEAGYVSCTRLQKIRNIQPEKTGGAVGITIGR